MPEMTCYRHSGRVTRVSCSNCGRPICPDCMTPTPVGMRCPECARERTKVRTLGSRPAGPSATQVLIGLNVLAYLAETFAGGGGIAAAGGGSVFDRGALYGPAIANSHEYWRLVTGGFLHAGLLHIAMNMYFVYIIGNMIEPALGRARFLGVYFASLLAGSFGALLFTPAAHTVGASGAAFGLLGCAIVLARARGIDVWATGLLPILLINLVFSVSLANISIGGHLGGLAGGLISGWLVVELGERRGMRAAVLIGCVAVAAVAFAAGVAVAGSHGIAPHGISFR
jgi:membrane associated rhomboid family serine protease